MTSSVAQIYGKPAGPHQRQCPSSTRLRFGEEFVDEATDANNPVREVWDQAQLMWGPEPLEGRFKCLVSIGTGMPSLKPFKDDVLHISDTLIAMATETEQTAERFRRERQLLDSTGRYYRFNVMRGLEDIGLEEAAKVKELGREGYGDNA
ncbi:hypothetical protein EJ07DRAFT_158921 [Lizonia empirigonia]|nr:hypothetical protein EJ07DRAFT_158921 [Lizonia empirigonia]